MSSPRTTSKNRLRPNLRDMVRNVQKEKRKRTPSVRDSQKVAIVLVHDKTLYPLTEFRSSMLFSWVALSYFDWLFFVLDFLRLFFFLFFPTFLHLPSFQVLMMIFAFEVRKRPPFPLSSNTFFVQNYSQQMRASRLKVLQRVEARQSTSSPSLAHDTLALAIRLPKMKRSRVSWEEIKIWC